MSQSPEGSMAFTDRHRFYVPLGRQQQVSIPRRVNGCYGLHPRAEKQAAGLPSQSPEGAMAVTEVTMPLHRSNPNRLNPEGAMAVTDPPSNPSPPKRRRVSIPRRVNGCYGQELVLNHAQVDPVSIPRRVNGCYGPQLDTAWQQGADVSIPRRVNGCYGPLHYSLTVSHA